MEFRLLGGVDLEDAGRHIDLGPPKQRCVLAALLLADGEALSSDQLAERVWGDRPPDRYRNVLASYVSRLRRTFQTASGEVVIEYRARGYSLATPDDSVDLFRFRRRVIEARAAAAAGEDERASALLDRALALWRGRPLSGLDGPWAAETAVHLEGELRDARAFGVEVLLRLGRQAEAVEQLRRFVAQHPLDERFTAQLMAALDGLGRTTEAIGCYHELRTRLAAELGVDPAPGLQESYLELVQRAPLRDEPHQEPHQEPSAPLPRPAQLPAPIAGFTGRTAQLQRLDQFFAAGDTVIVSAVTGGAGVGKTALAVHWAHRNRQRFHDGQLYVNLGGYATTPRLRPLEALSRFLRALGVPSEQVPVEEEEAAALYRSLLADRHVLVVLDNAADADQVRLLLPGGPGSIALVTSRDSLTGLIARDGAALVDVDVLAAAEAQALLVRLLGGARVAGQHHAVAALAKACAYLPLALRIAAAHLISRPDLPLATYVAELERGNRLEILQVIGDDQAAVCSTFDLSYRRLDPAGQRMFRLLGLVPGLDFTVDVAAALTGCAVGSAVPVLARLRNAHMIEERSVGRYAFHDLLRHYALERAGRNEDQPGLDAAADRLHSFYLQSVAAAARLLYPSVVRLPTPTADPGRHAVTFRDPLHAAAWLEAELPNLVAAVTVAAEHGPSPRAYQIADALRGFLWLRAYRTEWATVAHAAQAAAEAVGEPAGRAAAHLGLGHYRMLTGRHEESIDHYHRALAFARRAGWVAGQAAALAGLGPALAETGQPARAVECLVDALELQRHVGLPAVQASSHQNLGLLYGELGQLEHALEHFTRALHLFREVASQPGQCAALTGIGEACRFLGRLSRAEESLRRARDLARAIGDAVHEPHCVNALAAVHCAAGRYGLANELAELSVSMARAVGQPRIVADTLNTLASVRSAQGDHREAAKLYRQALDQCLESKPSYTVAEARVGLAGIHNQLGEAAQARAHAQHALTIARQAGHRLIEGVALTELAKVDQRTGADDRAIERANRAVAIHRETGHRPGLARALIVLAEALAATDPAAAAVARREAGTILADP